MTTQTLLFSADATCVVDSSVQKVSLEYILELIRTIPKLKRTPSGIEQHMNASLPKSFHVVVRLSVQSALGRKLMPNGGPKKRFFIILDTVKQTYIEAVLDED